MEKIKNNITSRRISSVIMVIIILAATGLIQFTTMKFSADSLKDPMFYVKLLYRVILIVLGYSAAIGFLYDKDINADYIIDNNTTFNQLLKLKGSNFPEFIEYLNNEIRKSLFKNNMIKKIAKLELKISKTKKVSKIDRITQRINKYKERITPEYLEDHKEFLPVKFERVLESDFMAITECEEAEKYKIRVSYSKIKNRKMMSRIYTFLITSIIFSMALTEMNETNNAGIIAMNLIFDLGVVAGRFINGLMDSKKIIDETFYFPVLKKIEFMKQYIDWDKSETSKSQKIISYIESNKGE